MSFEASLQSLMTYGLIGLVVTATIAGFIAGLTCAPWLQEWTLRRAARRVQTLHSLMVTELARIERMCRLLNESTGGRLSTDAWERLEQAKHQFYDAWRITAERHAPREDVVEQPASRPTAKPFRVEWVRDAIAETGRAVNRAGFDKNLSLMLEGTTTTAQPSGLLLVRVDKCDQLQRRFGNSVVEQLLQRLGDVVQQAARTDDLVCRLTADLFAVLMPAVSPMAGARVAEAVRSAVRQHPFRLDESGPEMIVTASFGYGVCLPSEPGSLPMDRASEALSKSQSLGRNQLHVHDATQRKLSRVG